MCPADFLNVEHVEYYKMECLHGVPDFKLTIGVVNKIPAHVRAFYNIMLASVFFSLECMFLFQVGLRRCTGENIACDFHACWKIRAVRVEV